MAAHHRQAYRQRERERERQNGGRKTEREREREAVTHSPKGPEFGVLLAYSPAGQSAGEGLLGWGGGAEVVHCKLLQSVWLPMLPRHLRLLAERKREASIPHQ